MMENIWGTKTCSNFLDGLKIKFEIFIETQNLSNHMFYKMK